MLYNIKLDISKVLNIFSYGKNKGGKNRNFPLKSRGSIYFIFSHYKIMRNK